MAPQINYKIQDVVRVKVIKLKFTKLNNICHLS